MASKLYEKDSYTIKELDFIHSTYIREYDIAKANISILLELGKIKNDEYLRLLNMEAKSRKIEVGNLMNRDESVKTALSNGFVHFRKLFFEANNIQDIDVISIKKDAIYLHRVIPKFTNFGNVNFLVKNVYSAYFKIMKTELYYWMDLSTNQERLDVKGISDDVLLLHRNYMIEFINTVIYELQVASASSALDIVNNFFTKYINLELEPEYYREFNAQSIFRFKHSKYYMYGSQMVAKEDLSGIDIGYNREFISTLHSYISRLVLK